MVSTRPPVQRLAVQPRLRGRAALLGLLAAGLAAPGRPADPFRSTDSAHVHVLHGLGGSGKTTIALALARESLDRGVRTWWVPARDPGQARAGLRAIAVELGATPDQLYLGSSPDQLWRLLNDLDQPWLMVIDNADDPLRTLALPADRVADATGWLRPVGGRYGMVVVTTRDGCPLTWGEDRASWLRMHRVAPLAGADGALVLRELAGDSTGSTESARRLSERLGGLPLALRLAGRFLGEAARMPVGISEAADVRTFDAFRAALDQGRHPELLRDDEDDLAGPAVRAPIGRTWELSLEQLDALGMPEARTLLALLSCLGAAPVPYGLLLQTRIMGQSPLFAGLTGRRLWSVLRALASLGLVDLYRDDAAEPVAADTLVLPPLVRDTARAHAVPAEHGALAADLLTAAVRGLDPRDAQSWQRWRLLAEHCSSPLELLLASSPQDCGAAQDVALDLLDPALHAARYLCAAGHLSRAATRYTTLIHAGHHLLGPDHPRVIGLQHDLCRVWYDAGQYTRAKRDFHVVFEARGRVLGSHHPDTLTTADHLARALFEHGQLADAHRLSRTVLDLRSRVLGAGHVDTMTSMIHLAMVLRAQGRRAEAEAMLRHLRRAHRDRLGEDHPAALLTRHHLAAIAADQGGLAPAEAELRQVCSAFDRVLGTDHPWTLAAQQSLADVCHDRGQLDEAERLVLEVLHARHRVLGYDHPHTLTTRHRLGLILIDRGDPDGAAKELQSVLAVRRRVLAPHHPDTARTAHSLDTLRRRRWSDRPMCTSWAAQNM